MATKGVVQTEYVAKDKLDLQVTDIGGGKKLCIFTDDRGRDILIATASVHEDYHDKLYESIPVVWKEAVVSRIYDDIWEKDNKNNESKIGNNFAGFDWNDASSAVSNVLTFGYPAPEKVVSEDKKKTMTIYASAVKSGRHHRLSRLFIIIH
jgi:hypothetical protein